MEVWIPSYSGFCPGVKIAEREITKQIKSEKKIYILGELIHNQNYIDFLSQNNVKTVRSLEEIPAQASVMIRTHGIRQDLEKQMRKSFHVTDLTCYKVKDLQSKIKDYAKKNFFVIISGKKKHPEVRGLLSYAKDSYVIETIEELNALSNKLSPLLSKLKNYKKILITSQTTASRTLFERVTQEITQIFQKSHQIDILDSICSITSMREQRALEIQKKVDITFVIGDPKSSNANKLYQILKKNKPATFFVEDLKALKKLKLDLKSSMRAQVVSSSSTPSFLEQEICDYLKQI